MKKYLVGILVLMLALTSIALAANFEEEVATASVTVNQYVSITLTDPGASGINFGSLDPGTSDNPEAAQNGAGAITVTNDAVSNVNIKINVKGTDFSDGGVNSFAVSQATYDDDNTPSEGAETGKTETAMANTYPVSDYYTGVTPGSSEDFWFFLDVPSSQTAASYTSTFTFKGNA